MGVKTFKKDRNCLLRIRDYRLDKDIRGGLKQLKYMREYVDEYAEVTKNGYIKVDDAQDVFDYMQSIGLRVRTHMSEEGNLECSIAFLNEDNKIFREYVLISYIGLAYVPDYEMPVVHFFNNILSGDEYIGFTRHISSDKECTEYFSLTTLKWESMDIGEGIVDDGVQLVKEG